MPTFKEKRYKIPKRKPGMLATEAKRKFKGEWYTCHVAYKNKTHAKREAEIAKKDHGYKKARIARYKPKYGTEWFWGVFVRKT